MNGTIQEPKTPKDAGQHLPAAGNNPPQEPQKLSVATTSTEQKVVNRQPSRSPVGTGVPSPLKSMNKGRFFFGMLLCTAGVGLLLLVAVGIMQHFGAGRQFSLPLVAIAAIVGVMLLGGGFGVMATASGGLDDGEFERLMQAGNISSVTEERSGFGEESSDAKQWSNVPTGGSSEQGNADDV